MITGAFHERHPAFTLWVILGVMIAAFVNIRVASAHVTINPAIVRPNVYQAFTVDVPTEKTVPTITVRVEFPPELRVARFQPKEGWERAVEKDPAGNIVAATWSGGSIAADEYEEFVFLARTPREPGPLVFRAYQTYEGGETVAWTGAELDNFPASVVQVTDEAPEDGTEAVASIEEPSLTAASEATAVAEGETAEATTVTIPTEPSPTTLPATSTPVAVTATGIPSATIVPAGAVDSGAGIDTASAATPVDSGSDLGLFVALAALVVALLGTAIATVGLLRRRGAP